MKENQDRKKAKQIYQKHHGKIDDFKHIHHIISIKEGGDNSIENLIALSPEDHFKLHYSNWKKYGNYHDLSAAHLLQKNGMFGLTDDEKRIVCSNAGKKGGRIQVELGLGIHKQTKEERLELASKGGKSGLFSLKWYENNGYNTEDAIEQRKKDQSKRGQIGGVKNKGFIWINDGIKTYKYTAKQQKEIPIELYLIKNNMQLGRIVNKTNKFKHCKHCNKKCHILGITTHEKYCKSKNP